MRHEPRSVIGEPVAVAPDPGPRLEVGGAHPRAVGVAPQADRHRGHRRRDHELPLHADAWPALGIERLHPGAEHPAADLPGPDRNERRRPEEPGAQVRAAAQRPERDGARDVLGDPPEPGRRQRRPRRADAAQRHEVQVPAGLQAGRPARHQERGADAEVGAAGLGGQPPQRGQVRPGGVAVEQHDARPDGEPRHEVVPHHPAGRREPAEAVVGAEIRVERERLEVLEEDAAVAVDDRLGQARGPRREQHVQRVVEGDGVEDEGRRVGDEPRPGLRAGHGRHGVGLRAQVGDDDGGAKGGQRGADLAPPPPPGRCPGHRTGSRRRPAGPWARSGRTGRRRPSSRTPARRTTRRRRARPWPGGR